MERVFLKISQNSQEKTYARFSACNFIKKETLAQVFSVNFVRFLITPPVGVPGSCLLMFTFTHVSLESFVVLQSNTVKHYILQNQKKKIG